MIARYIRLIARLQLLPALLVGAMPALAQEVAGSTDAKFSVTPDGTAAYTVPLMVPPGTAGVAPKLSLTYSSRGGVSAFGFGWSVTGLSQIQRGPRNLTDDGKVAGVRFSADDALYLDGEKLVEVPSDQAGVREYRTRTDSMVRVRAYQGDPSGPGYLIVETRAGLKMTYGATAASRVALANGSTVTWLCDRIEDRSGNYMVFSYRFDDAGGKTGLDYVIDRVDYTGNTAAGLAPYAAIVFDYERLPADKAYGSRYLAGQRTTLAWRLRSITSSYKGSVLRRYVPSFTGASDSDRFTTIANLTEEGADGRHHKPLSFDYPKTKPGWQPSDLLASITDLPGVDAAIGGLPKSWRFAKLPTASGAVPGIIVAASAGGKTIQTAFVHDAVTGKWTEVKALAPPVLFANGTAVADDVFLIDVDQDGDDDLVSGDGLAGNEAATWIATPTGWEKKPALPVRLTGGTLAASGILAVDIRDTANNRQTALAWNFVDPANGKQRRAVERWDGSDWVAVAGYTPPLPFGVGGRELAGVRAIDVDGDGVRELLWFSVAGNGRRDVWRATATGWQPLTDAKFTPTLPDLPVDAALRVADMNNDGQPDLVYAFEQAGQRSTGIQLASSTGWRADVRTLPNVAFWRDDDDPVTGVAGEVLDLNGDGLPDFADRQGGAWVAWRAQADKWVVDEKLAPPAAIGSTTTERALSFALLRLPGSGAWTWFDLRPAGGALIPRAYRFDGALGWQADKALKLPIDLARFDKVDLGVRFLDLNNDGWPDLVWSRERTDGSLDRAVYIFEPRAATPWRKDDRYILPVALVREDYAATGVFIADINGDGRADLIQGRRMVKGGKTIELREAWINCSALPDCASVAEGTASGYWLAASTSPTYSKLVPPTVFAEDNVGPLGAQILDVDGDGLADIVSARTVEAWVDKGGLDVTASTPGASPVYRLDAHTWLNSLAVGWVESTAFRLPVALARPLIKAIPNGGIPTPGGGIGDDAPFPNITMVDTRVLLVDLDGDRLPDVSWRYEAIERNRPVGGTVVVDKVERSGARLGSPDGWVSDTLAYVPPVRLDDDRAAPERQLQVEDVNNDGALDLVFSDGAQSATYLNTGIGWSGADADYKIPAKAIRAGKGDQGFRMLDLNGDMLVDIAYSWKTDGGLVRGAYLNTGIGWSEAPSDFTPGLPFAEDGRGDLGVRPLDVNGDGLLDLVQAYKRSNDEKNDTVVINTSNRGYLLDGIVNGAGSSVTVRYQSFLSVQRPDERAIKAIAPVRVAPGSGQASIYPFIHAPLSGYLVGEVTEEGTGVVARRLRYAYDGNRVDIRSGRSLGFEVSIVTDVERDRETLTRFSQDDAILGSPIFVETRQGGKLIASSTSIWTATTSPGLVGSSGAAGFAPQITRRSLVKTSSQSWDFDGTLLSSEASTFTYDADNNPVRVLVDYGDGSATLTENAFADDTLRWALARLVSAKVTMSAPGRVDQVRAAGFTYDQATGLIASETALAGTPLETLTVYVRDKFGNKIASTLSAPDGTQARTERVELDGEGRFAIASYNALGQRAQASYDGVSGVVLARTDPNGLMVKSRYNSLQRLIAEISPAGVETSIVTEASARGDAAIVVTRRTPGLPTLRKWSDSGGREVRTELTGWRGRTVVTETHYDTLGRAIEATAPRFAGEPALISRRRFDGLDRLLSETRPDGAVLRIEYRGRDTITTDYAGRRVIKRLDARGRTRETVDALGGVTRFTLDAGGRVASTTTVAGLVVAQAYDAAGNRILLDDPAAGQWRYSYDIYGRMIQQTDPRGKITRLDYDALDRVVAKRNDDTDATWRYDAGAHAIGRLVASSSGRYRRSYRYDALGRAQRSETVTGRDTLVSIDSFDTLGRVIERRFDTGVTMSRRYDAQGFLVGLSFADGSLKRDVYSLLDVDAEGRAIRERVGNGIETRNDYDAATGRLKRTTARAGATAIQDLTLQYDIAGNVTAMADATTGETGAFGYDALRRITRSELSGRAVVEVSYDAIGNITAKTDAGNYSYCDRGTLKQLLCSVAGPGGTIALEYDQAGNVVRRGDKTLSFDANGKVSEIRGPSLSRSRFEYDGDGTLAFQDSVYGPKQHKYATSYLGDVQIIRENYAPPNMPTPERTIVRYSIASSTGVIGYYDKIYRHYPYRFAAPIYGQIMTDKPERVTDLKFALTYLIKDQLGSIRALVSEDGNVVDRFRYDPWGRRIEGEGYRYRHVKEGFTGQEMLDNLDLIHMGGRVYDPLLGRFMSADPYIQAPGYSQSYNRYAYVMNNPLVLVDPSGYWSLGGFFHSIFHAAGDAFRWVVDTTIGKPLAWVGEQLAKGGRWLQQNWKTVAIVALAVWIGPASSLLLAVVEGAALGGLSAALYGGGPDEILRGALIGGATAGAFYGVGSAGIQNEFAAAGAHGVVGGLSSVASGGDFQSGFLSAGVTRLSSSYTNLSSNRGYQVASAAVVGGVASEIGGGSFENGAITGAFSRLFNECAHGDLCKGGSASEGEPGRVPASASSSVERNDCLGATAGIGLSLCGNSISTLSDMQLNLGMPDVEPFGPTGGMTVGYGKSGFTLGGQAGFQAGFGLSSATLGGEINFAQPIESNMSMGVKVGPYAPSIKVYPLRDLYESLRNLEPNIHNLYNVPNY